MMTIQNVHQVSDPQPTVEAAMQQLGHMLDDALADLAKLFEVNGEPCGEWRRSLTT